MSDGIIRNRFNISLGRILGIKVDLHISFFIILILLGVFLSIRTFRVLGFGIGFGGLDIPIYQRWVMGMITSTLIFTTLFMHELAHSLISTREGYKVRGITLFMLGGMSKADTFPEDPATELKIAGVGPLVSVLIGSASLLLRSWMSYYVPIGEGPFLIIAVFLASVGFYNLIIGIFNLIPAFPLDGGRILRSLLGNFMDHHQATLRAARIGKAIAIVMGIFGVFTVNLLLILIAVFVYMGAKNEKDVTEAMHALHDLPIKKIMRSRPRSVKPDLSLDDLKERMMRERRRIYLVKRRGKIIGIVSMEDLRAAMKGQTEANRVSDIMKKDFVRTSPDDEASEVWKRMLKEGATRVIVIKKGAVKGQVTMADFRNAIDINELSSLSGSWTR